MLSPSIHLQSYIFSFIYGNYLCIYSSLVIFVHLIKLAIHYEIYHPTDDCVELVAINQAVDIL